MVPERLQWNLYTCHLPSERPSIPSDLCPVSPLPRLLPPRSLSQNPCESGRRMRTRSWQAARGCRRSVPTFCVTRCNSATCGGGHSCCQRKRTLTVALSVHPRAPLLPSPTAPPAGVQPTSFHFDSDYSSSCSTSNALPPATHPWHGCAADSQSPVSPGNQPPKRPGSSSM